MARWVFQGTYSGEAKEYVKIPLKKEYTFYAWSFSIVLTVALLMIEIFMNHGEDKVLTIFYLCFIVISVALLNVILWTTYRRDPKCNIKIENDGLYVFKDGNFRGVQFYKLDPIEYHDDFIGVCGAYALQKDLLVEGSWEELQTLIKKIEESLDTDAPIYQLEDETECIQATVQSKRIYEKFVPGVSLATPVGVYQYWIAFTLEKGETVEYEVSQEWYEKLQEGATGTLVVTNGVFFTFDDEE
jgi:hypothetical protein